MVGMKPRRKPEYKPTCEVRLKRSDGYTSEANGLSYEAGLGISVIINRQGVGKTTVFWHEDGKKKSVEIP